MSGITINNEAGICLSYNINNNNNNNNNNNDNNNNSNNYITIIIIIIIIITFWQHKGKVQHHTLISNNIIKSFW